MNGTNGTTNGTGSQPPVHKIYLVRHGESAANVAQINFPPEEDILTETGRKQADLLGKHLKDVVFTKAYASTYARANDTANFILTNSNMKDKPELKIDARIREREMGDFVNRPAKEAFGALIQAVKQGTSILKFEIPGAETAGEFDSRIDSFIENLYNELRCSTKPETVLIVSHGLTIMRLMAKFKEWEHSKNHSLESWTLSSALTPMKNTSYHIFTAKIPPKDCNDKVCLQFLEYHNRCHLDCLDGETGVDHGGPIASIFTKMVEMEHDKEVGGPKCAVQ